MELVRAASLTGYFAVAEQLGLEVLPLLRRSGLTRPMLANPEQVIPARSAVRLLEESAEATGCLTFGLHMTAPPKIIQQLYRHPLTDAGIKSFLADWEKTGQKIG